MEPDQKEILISRRVELVEDIDIQGGLFTQLLSRKVLLKRAVNKIKLNRTPEEQVEELLNELPRRDCFSDFCDALIADGQEHIVKKYLKAPLPAVSSASASSQSAEGVQAQVPASVTQAAPKGPDSSSLQASPAEGVAREENSAEITDSLASITPAGSSQLGLKRVLPAANQGTSTAMICIREEDNQHLIIRYSEEGGASPVKQQKRAAIIPQAVTYEPDETRYAMKHYVSQETGGGDLSLVPRQHEGTPLMVLNNPQDIGQNPNIVDLMRYSSAFPMQHHPRIQETSHSPLGTGVAVAPAAQQGRIINGSDFQSPSGIQIAAVPPSSISSPLREPSIRLNQQDAQTAYFNTLLQPQPRQPGLNVDHLKASNSSGFVRINPASRVAQFQDPQQLLSAAGTLPASAKMRAASPHQEHQQSLLSRYDSVDTASLSSPAKSIHVTNMTDGGFLRLSSLTDQYNSPLRDSSSLNVYNNKITVVGGGADPDMVCDMDQIDLPDGCVNVKVEHCSKDFFLANHKKAYPMRQVPRGLALIINVDEVEGKPPRKGTNFDRDNLCNLLCQLHFSIIVYNDKDGLSAQEMVNKLKDFARLPEHADMDACFVCLLSHGEEGFIFGTDGKRIPLEEIFMLFGNTSCKGLIGKPKVFIIQACRGGFLDKGVRMDEVDGGTLPLSSQPSSRGGCNGGQQQQPQQLPSMSDMLVCYPTLAGYYAWRNRARGSWYIEAIVQVFMRYAKCEDICAMLNRVNQLVSKKVSECNQKEMNAMSQMSEYKSSLRQPHLYLFPGIGISMR